ncbi:MAG: RHS repeat-associated core domain-containing protein, partial [Candidatus Acidiferrales bacterium]
NGSVSSIQNNANSGLSETFSYDYLNRILSAATTATSGSGCWGQSFGPSGTPPPGPADDAYSNLTQINATNCTVGALGIAVSATTNRVTTTGYAFDAAGNMTQEPSPNGYGYTYDAENHLTQVTGTGSGTWTYVYDGNGMRVEKSNASGGTLYFRSLSGATIAETDLSGNITSEYIFFAGQRIARRDANNNVYYYYTDQVGSTTTITTGTGSPCYDATFTPYGEEHNTLNTCPQNYKFTGYERDPETGLDYAFARFYNSRLGRFMSADPLNGDTGDPQSLNRYAYVLNNSTNLNDPLGFKCYVGEGCHDLGFGAWGGWGWGFGIAVANGNLGPGFPATDDWTYTFVDTWTRPDGTIGQYSETSGGTVDAPTFPFFPSDDLAGAGGGSTLQNIRNIINRALKQSRLSQCLHQFFGSGSILTNQNLPYIDATQTSIQLGAMGTVADPVPPSGRSTVEIASDVVNNSFAPELGQRVYLHEVANALAYQDFTNSPYGVRPFLGPFGGPPTSSQRAQNQPGGDPDIGREFEKCVFGNSLSGNGKN